MNEKIIEKTVQTYLPFIATENLLMEAVKQGGDRQALHEIIRKCSMEATEKMKQGEECDLIARLAAAEGFGLSEEEINNVLSPEQYIGRCPQQVDAYLEKIQPLLSGITSKGAEINL